MVETFKLRVENLSFMFCSIVLKSVYAWWFFMLFQTFLHIMAGQEHELYLDLKNLQSEIFVVIGMMLIKNVLFCKLQENLCSWWAEFSLSFFVRNVYAEARNETKIVQCSVV